MRWVKWIGGAVWAGSWYLMYLEITRWRHVKPSLAFNADGIRAAEAELGNDITPRPGLPLILLYVACAAAPPAVIAALVRQFSGARPNAGS